MPLKRTSLPDSLKKIVGSGSVGNLREDLVCYAYDATAQSFMPDAVVFPKDKTEIAAILKLANEKRFPVIPRGSGSGMTGGALAVQGGVVMVLKQLNRILAIDRDNLIAHVEPGVITADLHKAVEKVGLFYPPDPSSSEFSTLGGNAAECAGGPRAVKYGVTRDYILGLEVVLPNGEIIQTGVQTTKGVVGYDLTRLMIGSEGTLGIITRITVRLLPLPQKVITMAAHFDRIESATCCVSEIIRRGIIPRSIEYMDKASLQCVASQTDIDIPEQTAALLLLEVDGKETTVLEDSAQLEAICLEQGAFRFQTAQSEQEAGALKRARKSISPALFKYGTHKLNEDIVVPRSRIPDIVSRIDRLSASSGLTIVSFGHAGDGNIHVNVMFDKRDAEATQKAKRVVEEIFDYTLELGGTLSGEHGIGITKSAYLAKELGPSEIKVMKGIKRLFDPNGILNPGKIFP